VGATRLRANQAAPHGKGRNNLLPSQSREKKIKEKKKLPMIGTENKGNNHTPIIYVIKCFLKPNKKRKQLINRRGPPKLHLLHQKTQNNKPLTTTTSSNLTLLKFQNLTKKIKWVYHFTHKIT
jgi:hypothetical protein